MKILNDMETIKSKIRDNIQILIDDNKLDEAMKLIDEYSNIASNDIEIYSMRAVVLIMKGNINEAEKVLKQGLGIDDENFDLNYNLGYVYESKDEYELSVKYYKKSYISINDKETKENIKNVVKKILSQMDENKDVDTFLNSNCDENKKRCLILCHFYSVYTKEFLEKMYQNINIKFDILTIDKSYKENVKLGVINKVYAYNDLNEMNKILNTNEVYDIIHVHFLAPFYGQVAEQIRNKCNKLVITIWGSDFYRITEEQKEQQRNLIEKADIITFDNDVTLDEFVNYYGECYRQKSHITRFGLTALEYIKEIEGVNKDTIKKNLDIPEDSLVVTCGYNANPAHNHLKIIESIKKVKNKLPKNMYFIFPMTYSRDNNYVDIVKKELSISGLQYRILEDFMQFDEIAQLTRVSDIMIQVQTTDTLSATMQEHMYNGNVIITGSWLPYQPLKKARIFFLQVSSADKIGKKVIKVVKNIEDYKEKCRKNHHIIWNFSAWENTIKSWIDIYGQIVENKIEFDHAEYWDNRYKNNFTIEASGYMGLGKTYNEYLYKSRLDILKYLMKKIYGNLKDKDILELGSGTGIFTYYFYNQEGINYQGIEISRQAVSILSNIYKKFNFKVGDVSDVTSYKEKSKYDLIFAGDVLLHLTDDMKFSNTIHNISENLKEDGYFIEVDPITFNSTETTSPHNRIIKIEELKKILQQENLEIVDIIPDTFFMNYPFDYKVVDHRIMDIFNNIYKYFAMTKDDISYKKKISELIYILDKKCLLERKQGTSNRFLVIRKKKDQISNVNLSLEEVWNKKYIEEQIPKIKKFVEDKVKNKELRKIFENIFDIINESNSKKS